MCREVSPIESFFKVVRDLTLGFGLVMAHTSMAFTLSEVSEIWPAKPEQFKSQHLEKAFKLVRYAEEGALLDQFLKKTGSKTAQEAIAKKDIRLYQPKTAYLSAPRENSVGECTDSHS